MSTLFEWRDFCEPSGFLTQTDQVLFFVYAGHIALSGLLLLVQAAPVIDTTAAGRARLKSKTALKDLYFRAEKLDQFSVQNPEGWWKSRQFSTEITAFFHAFAVERPGL